MVGMRIVGCVLSDDTADRFAEALPDNVTATEAFEWFVRQTIEGHLHIGGDEQQDRYKQGKADAADIIAEALWGSSISCDDCPVQCEDFNLGSCERRIREWMKGLAEK